MVALFSSVDPIFYLHHGNLDRLWDIWTRRQTALGRPALPQGADLAAWSNEPFLFFAADKTGYVVEAAVPWARLGVTPKVGLALAGDVGIIFGNKGGTRNAIRYLWSDKSPEVSINNDIPSEVRIHPNQWGKLILR